MAEQDDHLYVDTTVFINFGQQLSVLTLITLLGERARIVAEVENELKRNSSRRDFDFLGTLNRVRGWPPAPPVELTPAQQAEVLDIKRANSRRGDHELADLGEIASVVVAKDDGMAPVASDDGLAAKLCSVRGLQRITSKQLIDQVLAAETGD